MRYLEDFEIGQQFTASRGPLSEEEIIAFAKDFDPQHFHLDPETAKDTLYGGLIASGWHTAAISMRLMCDAYMVDTLATGSPGVDELRWIKPVYPGDSLTARIQVDDVRPSQSRPTMGVIKIYVETLNQNNQVVLTFRGTVFVNRQPQT